MKQTYRGGPHTGRSVFVKFYPKASEEEHNTITRSIERLVAKGLLISYGRKTAQKWFTDTVSLTPVGKRRALSLYSEQARLPLQLSKAKKRR